MSSSSSSSGNKNIKKEEEEEEEEKEGEIVVLDKFKNIIKPGDLLKIDRTLFVEGIPQALPGGSIGVFLGPSKRKLAYFPLNYLYDILFATSPTSQEVAMSGFTLNDVRSFTKKVTNKYKVCF